MTFHGLLARLDAVRKTGKRWTARCPAHEDLHPSLSIHDGERGVLLRCWAGCSLDEICGAIGIAPRDLFYNADRIPSRRADRSTPQPERPEDREYHLWSCALGLRLRALAVFDAALGCDVSAWTDTDRDRAMRYVVRAHDDLRQAEVCDRLAFALRCELIEKRMAAA